MADPMPGLRRERLARYRADGVSAVRWICICDGRTCNACKALHDQVISLVDARWPKLMRLHAGCRCRFIMERCAPHERETSK